MAAQTPDYAYLAELGQQLRVDAVRASAAAGSGHPTSSMSAADLMAVLLARHLRYDFDAPEKPGNDHLIFSKGHASPLLYAAYKAAGVQRVFIWPIKDEIEQLRIFKQKIMPLVDP